MVGDICYQLNIWYTKQCELENKISNNKTKSSLSQLSFQNLFLQRFTTTERFKNWCLHLNTRVKIPSKLIPTFCKDFFFPAGSHCIHDKMFTANYHDNGKRPTKRFSIRSSNKRQKLGHYFINETIFQQLWLISVQTAFFWNFSFYIPNPVWVLKLGGEKVFNTFASKVNCCFILIGDFFIETEMYVTNN